MFESCTTIESRSLPPGSTLVDLVRYRALAQPDQTSHLFLERGETPGPTFTYGEIDRRARQIAAYLQACLPPGERVLLLFPQSPDFCSAFLGCLYAGMIAVPVNPPQNPRYLSRLWTIVQDTQAALILTSGELLQQVRTRQAMPAAISPTLRWTAIHEIPADTACLDPLPTLKSDAIAFLQFTSGSTAAPKGVMVSHGNLLHNLQLLRESFINPTDVNPTGNCLVNWLPFFHDWGLIGGLLLPLYAGVPCVVFDPIAFLQKPLRWLQAISRFRATVSGGPNFAYDLCLRHVAPDQLESLDLSSWQVAILGAETIQTSTLEKFSRAFAPYGFRESAFYTSYGLAENTLAVTGSRPAQRPPGQLRVSRTDLAEHRVAPATAGNSQTLASCGSLLPGQTLQIVRPDSGVPCDLLEVGEIWVAGASVAQGYWRQSQATAATFQARLATGEGPFLRTGDLGFIWNDELFVTGRLKEVIILAGRNYYPQDIEHTVSQSHRALTGSCSVAFAIPAQGTDSLVIVQELRPGQTAPLDQVIGQIQKAVAVEHRIFADAIALVRPGSIPKTSSGKLQRHRCKDLYLDNQLAFLARWQRPGTGMGRTQETEGRRQMVSYRDLT